MLDKKSLKSIILSFFGTIALTIIYKNSVFAKIPSIIFSFIAFLCLLLSYRSKNKFLFEKKELILSFVLSCFYSLVFTLGDELDVLNNIVWTYKTLFRIVLGYFSFYGPILVLFGLIKRRKNSISNIVIDKKLFLKSYLIILGFGFLTFLALYPGVYGYDAGFQILETTSNKVRLSTHFSLLHSEFLGVFVNIGLNIFKSAEIGLALYSLIQLSILTYAATRVTIFALKESNSKVVYILSLIFYSVFPLYTIMTISTCQDSLFAGIFALLIINLIEQNETPSSKKKVFKIFFLSFLFCIIRNNGFYAVVFLLFFQIFNKNYRVLKILPIILCVICYKVYTGPFYDLINIYKESPVREIMSVPSQQLARVYNYNPFIINQSDFNTYKKYYTNLNDFIQYTDRQSISDPIKNLLNDEMVRKDISGYINFWARMGIKDPKNYFEAFLLNSLGTWYPNKEFNDERMYHPYIEFKMLDAKKWNKDYVVIKRKSKFKIYNVGLSLLVDYVGWKYIPFVSFVFEAGTYFLVYIYTLGFVIIKKKRKYLIPLLFVGALYLTIILAPVSLFRYSFPIVMLLPLFVSILLSNNKKIN